MVASLVRKELLAVETDPFSPERGQLGFLQALVQRVTYETIARSDRRARHLAVARYLATEARIDPDEIAEVIATHYLDAHEADPTPRTPPRSGREARRWFTRAADRAASLAASLEAQQAFERAAGLTDEGVERGRSPEIPEDGRLTSEPVQAAMMLVLAQMSLYRGESERVHELAAEYAAWNETANVQATNVRSWARELLAQVEGRHDDALRESMSCLGDHRLAADPEAVAKFLELGCESAVFTADADALEELLAVGAAAPIDRPPSLEARTLLQRARLAALREEAEPRFDDAVTALRNVEEPFWVATALLEQAEWLAAHGRGDENGPLLTEARDVFERLRAQPRLERLDAVQATNSTPAPTSS